MSLADWFVRLGCWILGHEWVRTRRYRTTARVGRMNVPALPYNTRRCEDCGMEETL